MQSTYSGQITSSVVKGVRQAFPIVLGYVPIGVAYGLLAQRAGLSLWSTLGLSLFVCAGASQFMAVSMLLRGVEAAVIIGTTFIVNFRHVLMSASLAPSLGSWKTWQRLLLGGTLTDESFVMHSLNFSRDDLDPISAVTLNSAAYIVWAATGVAGHSLGVMIANPEAWGLDFALPAMFVGLLVSACANKPAVAAAVVGGTVSVGLHLVNAGSWAAFFGALAGATAGVLYQIEIKGLKLE